MAMGPPTPTGNQLGPPTPTGRNCTRENYEQKCCQHFPNRIALRGHGATNANWPSTGATHAKWSKLYQRKLRTEMLQTFPQSYCALMRCRALETHAENGVRPIGASNIYGPNPNGRAQTKLKRYRHSPSLPARTLDRLIKPTHPERNPQPAPPATCPSPATCLPLLPPPLIS